MTPEAVADKIDTTISEKDTTLRAYLDHLKLYDYSVIKRATSLTCIPPSKNRVHPSTPSPKRYEKVTNEPPLAPTTPKT